MKPQTEEQKHIKRLHKALDGLLALFVRQHGYDFFVVDEALDALAKSDPDLFITHAFIDAINAIRKGDGG